MGAWDKGLRLHLRSPNPIFLEALAIQVRHVLDQPSLHAMAGSTRCILKASISNHSAMQHEAGT